MDEAPRPDEADREELLQYVREHGATEEEAAAADNLGELALDLHLRPRSGATLGEVVESTGLDWERAARLVRAAGMVASRDSPVTEGEAAMLRLLASVGESMLGEEATVQLARVASGAMARLAEAIVAAFRLRFELPRRSAGTRYVDVVREYTEIAETMLPAFVGMLDVMLRRDIVAVAERMWSTDADQTAVTLPRAIGFADLVGYTEASAGLPARELASILAEFDERTAGVVAGGGGQVVKTIGDEAMFVTEDPADACRIAAALVRELGGGRLPAVRIGIAAGAVVSVLGDVFGPDVNLAARLVGAADPSCVVVSARVFEACAGDFTFESLGPLALKGFPAPVPAYRLDLASASHD